MNLDELRALVEKDGYSAVLHESAIPTAYTNARYSRPKEIQCGGALHVTDSGLDGPPESYYGTSPDPDFVYQRPNKVRLRWPDKRTPVLEVETRIADVPHAVVHHCPTWVGGGRCGHKSHETQLLTLRNY